MSLCKIQYHRLNFKRIRIYFYIYRALIKECFITFVINSHSVRYIFVIRYYIIIYRITYIPSIVIKLMAKPIKPYSYVCFIHCISVTNHNPAYLIIVCYNIDMDIYSIEFSG